MAKVIKPRPKNLKEIYNEQLPDAYAPGEVKPILNPDDREKNISTRGDRTKDVSIGLIDIDTAIIKYIEEKIKPSIIQDGERIKVPVMYGFPERWQTIQEKGYLREHSGRMLSPIIVFKRDSLEANRNISTKIDANNPRNFHVFAQNYTKANQYDNFSAVTNRQPVKEFRLIVVPEYCTLRYSAVIFTNHLEQNNKVIEAFQYAANTYWGEENRFLFRSNISTFNTSTEYSAGDDRTTRTNFEIVLNGYTIPDTVNRDISYPKKFYSKSQIIFNLETDVSDIFTVGRRSGETFKRGAVNFPTAPQNPFVNVGEAIIYTNTNKTVTATSSLTTTITATFPNSWITAPSPLPVTSLDNFTFFCNGQYIEKSAIVSFIDNGNNTSTLTIDPNELSYEFETSDEIIGIGKFS